MNYTTRRGVMGNNDVSVVNQRLVGVVSRLREDAGRLSLKEAVDIYNHQYAAAGRKASTRKMLRWIKVGLKRGAETTTRLDGYLDGDLWVTSREALERFTQAVTVARNRQPRKSPPPRTIKRKPPKNK